MCVFIFNDFFSVVVNVYVVKYEHSVFSSVFEINFDYRIHVTLTDNLTFYRLIIEVPLTLQNGLTLRFISCSALLIILIIIAMTYPLMPTVRSLTGVRISYFSIDRSLTASLLDLLETPSDSRVRLAKLKGISVLSQILMWIAFPTTDAVVSGTNWHESI